MHGYDISIPENEPLPSLNEVVGVVVQPHAYKICVKPRADIPKVHVDNMDVQQLPVQQQNHHQHRQEDGVLRNVGSY